MKREEPVRGSSDGWRRAVAVLWLAEFIAIMGMSLVIPFLPLYLGQLHVPESRLNLWAGWVGGANFLCAALVAPFWGALADRFGKKPMVLRALAGLALSVGLMALAQNAWQLFFCRMVQGAFGGFVAAAISLAGSLVPKAQLGQVLGTLQSAVVAGNLMGPLVGGELSHRFGYRPTFLITAGLLVTAAGLVAWLIREPSNTAPVQENPSEPKPGIVRGLMALGREPGVVHLLTVVLITQGAIMLIHPQIPLLVREIAPRTEDVNRLAGWIAAAPGFSSLFLARWWGGLGDRRGPALVLVLALAGAGFLAPWAAGCLFFWQLFLLRFLMGGFTAGINPASHSVVARLAPEEKMAGAFSLVSSAQMLGSCIGPFLSGPAAAAWGIRPLFLATGCLLGCAACLSLPLRARMGASLPGGSA